MWLRVIFSLAVFVVNSVSAQDIGTLGTKGQPIIPSDEGNLLLIQPGAVGVPVYTFVRKGGKKVVIMTAAGDALTPQAAWETYGGQAIQLEKPAKVRVGGTLSFPSSDH